MQAPPTAHSIPAGDNAPTTTVDVAQERLTAFLHHEAFPDASDVEILSTLRPSGGASWETFICTLRVATSSRQDTRRVVIKRAPATGPLAPYDVAKDVTIFRTLAGSDVRVPRLLAWTNDHAVFSGPFTVTEFVEGESHDITKVETWPIWKSHREALGNEIIDNLARLQRFPWQSSSVADVLGVSGSASERAARIVDRYLVPLLELAHERGMSQPLWRELGQWIKDNAPDIDEQEMVIVHGDYRFGNFLWQDTKLAAIIDWERAMLGPPMQELGFICMPLSRRTDPQLMGKALTFPQLAARYEASTGRSVDVSMILYYAVIWQFIEGVNATRGLLASSGHGMVSSSGLIQPNLVARQTLQLIDDREQGRNTL